MLPVGANDFRIFRKKIPSYNRVNTRMFLFVFVQNRVKKRHLCKRLTRRSRLRFNVYHITAGKRSNRVVEYTIKSSVFPSNVCFPFLALRFYYMFCHCRFAAADNRLNLNTHAYMHTYIYICIRIYTSITIYREWKSRREETYIKYIFMRASSHSRRKISEDIIPRKCLSNSRLPRDNES